MDERLAVVLEELGVRGIEAFYVYLALDYLTLWTLIGLMVWGVRILWNKIKNDF